MNFSTYEDVLISFNQNLFQNNGKFLNANGPGSTVVLLENGNSMGRDSNGCIRPLPTKLKDSQPATHNNVLHEIEKLIKSSSSDPTIIFSDHGSQSGTALWNQQILSKNDLLDVTKLADKNKSIRTIHLHCFAGSMLHSPDVESEKDFLKDFPQNLCSLAASTHLDLTSATENIATAELTKTQRISLKKLQEKAMNNPKIDNLFMLTSDYAAIAASKIICNEMSRRNSILNCKNNSKLAEISLLPNLLPDLLCSMCNNVFPSKDQSNPTLEYASDLDEEFNQCEQEIVNEFFKKKKPERYNLILSKLKKNEKELTKQSQVKDQDVCYNAKMDYPPLEQMTIDKYEILSSNNFVKVVSQSKWSKGKCLINLSKYGMSDCLCKKHDYHLLSEFLKKSIKTYFDIRRDIRKNKSDQITKKREEDQEKLKSCHLLTHSYASTEIRNRYEKILACETSPLN